MRILSEYNLNNLLIFLTKQRYFMFIWIFTDPYIYIYILLLIKYHYVFFN
jgi:hypothetical protein